MSSGSSVFAEHVPIGGEADADFGEFFFGGAAAGAAVVLVLLLLFGAEDLEDGVVAGLAGAEGGGVAGETFEFHGGVELGGAAGHEGEDLVLLGVVEGHDAVEAADLAVGLGLDLFEALLEAVGLVGGEVWALEGGGHEGVEAVVGAFLATGLDDVFEGGVVAGVELAGGGELLFELVFLPEAEGVLLGGGEVVFAGEVGEDEILVAAEVLALEAFEDGGEVAEGGFGGLVDVVEVDFAAVLEVFDEGAGAAGEFLLGGGLGLGSAGLGGGEEDAGAGEFAVEVGEAGFEGAGWGREALLEEGGAGEADEESDAEQERGAHGEEFRVGKGSAARRGWGGAGEAAERVATRGDGCFGGRV